MEDIERMMGDFALDQSLNNIQELTRVIPRAQDKLKIMEAALCTLSVGDVEQEEVPEESFAYIPLDLSDFFESMFNLEEALMQDEDYRDADLRHRRVSFVEAGCGSGRHVFLLKSTDRFELLNVHGFDFSKALIDHGHKLFGLEDDIFIGNCNDFDFSPYQVAFFYRPFSDNDAEVAFEQRLIENIAPGSYIIGCGNLSLSEDRRLISKCDNGRVYKKLR